MRFRPLLFLAVVPLALHGCGPAGSTVHAANGSGAAELLSVDVFSPEKKMLRRTTTQPATVHAYFQAEIHARATGYLRELRVDIGSEVEDGSVLGIVDVPEMIVRRERQEAVIQSRVAVEERAAADVAVAGASVESHDAMLDETLAVIREHEANLKKHEIEFQRVQTMVQDRAGTQQELDEAEAKYESSRASVLASQAGAVSAKANVALASAKLTAARADQASARAQTDVARRELEELDELMSFAILRSPLGGVVLERNVDPGDLVRETPSDRNDAALFVIAQLDRVRVRVSIPERDAPWVTVGDPATLILLSMPGQPLAAAVARTAASLHMGTRTLQVEIDLPNDDRALLPGMFGEVTIVLEEHEALVLPAAAVHHDEVGNSHVYIVDGSDVVQVVDVSTGLDDGREIEIIGGLEGGERVIGSTIGRIRPGAMVRVRG